MKIEKLNLIFEIFIKIIPSKIYNWIKVLDFQKIFKQHTYFTLTNRSSFPIIFNFFFQHKNSKFQNYVNFPKSSLIT